MIWCLPASNTQRTFVMYATMFEMTKATQLVSMEFLALVASLTFSIVRLNSFTAWSFSWRDGKILQPTR